MKITPTTNSELFFAQLALIFAIALQIITWSINDHLSFGPRGILVATEMALMVIIGLTATRRHIRPHSMYRKLSILLLAIITLVNIASFFTVIRLLLTDGFIVSGRELILAALAIFLTNIIVFALWYWEIDSPGLTGYKWNRHDKEFRFTQQLTPKDFPDWQPTFIDYLYMSVTNAINFAPADALPITTNAKMLMGLQAMVSAFTLALIVARSINILS